MEIVEQMSADGFAMLSTTVLRGQTVIRLCPINPLTTEDEVRATVHRLDAFVRTLS